MDGGDDASPADVAVDADASPIDAGVSCEDGSPSCPFVIALFPYSHSGDTRSSVNDSIDTYDCSVGLDESGPEHFFSLELGTPGFLRVVVDDVSGDRVDVDVHLVQGGQVDGSGCLARDNVEVSTFVEAGAYFIVVDTWVDGSGVELAGPYRLDVFFSPLPAGLCAMEPRELATAWTECATDVTFNCYDGVDPADGRTRRFVSTPAFGAVVKEAHLVTVDDGFGSSWPSSFYDGIPEHYALSEAATGYTMSRTEPWAPAGEGGSEFGQGSFGSPLPVVAESWYVNMYWRHRPSAGARMIAFNPENGRAVVLAAGYETGPGSNTAIGGFTEEAHDHLGTGHRDSLVLGFAVDQSLPYGPIDCP